MHRAGTDLVVEAGEAQDRVAALRPKSITCNQCQAEITAVQDMDTKGMEGIEAAFGRVRDVGHVLLPVLAVLLLVGLAAHFRHRRREVTAKD